jgi:hypothetical protein
VALGQLVGYHADDLPAGLQAGELGGTIGTSGVAGHKDISLLSGLSTDLLGKNEIILADISASYQRNTGFLQ